MYHRGAAIPGMIRLDQFLRKLWVQDNCWMTNWASSDKIHGNWSSLNAKTGTADRDEWSPENDEWVYVINRNYSANVVKGVIEVLGCS